MSGDENSAKDTRAMINACNVVSMALSATTMLVHHLGHNSEAKQRARGSSAWRGALDASILVHGKSHEIVVSCTKQKDAPEPSDLFGCLSPVDLGWQDEDGMPLPGAVFEMFQEGDLRIPQPKADQLSGHKTNLERAWFVGGAEIVDEMPYNLDKRAFGLDFGFTNDPTTLVECGISDGEIYGRELIYQTGLTNRDINALFIEHGIRKSEPIFADSADPKSIYELKMYGWNIMPAEKGPDSIPYSINLLKQYGKMNLTRHSQNWIKEAQNYKWKEARDGKKLPLPVDAFNHAWDACRYWALGMLKKGHTKNILAYG
jgi:hypothetical protein